MSHRWSGLYAFHWAPILTFERRKTAAFEWLEANAKIVSFLAADDQFGVAIGRRATRVVVRRGGFELLLGAEDAEIHELLPALAGILSVFEPRHMHAVSARVLHSVDMNFDYDRLRRAAAEGWTGRIDGVAVRDFSAILDMETPTASVQAEIGIVDAGELRQRLTTTDMGRLRAAEMPPVQGIPADMARCSLFADVTRFTTGIDAYSGVTGVDNMCHFVESRVTTASEETSSLAASLAEAIAGKGQVGEFSRGA